MSLNKLLNCASLKHDSVDLFAQVNALPKTTPSTSEPSRLPKPRQRSVRRLKPAGVSIKVPDLSRKDSQAPQESAQLWPQDPSGYGFQLQTSAPELSCITGSGAHLSVKLEPLKPVALLCEWTKSLCSQKELEKKTWPVWCDKSLHWLLSVFVCRYMAIWKL